jgi:Cysteine dioxygenase type I
MTNHVIYSGSKQIDRSPMTATAMPTSPVSPSPWRSDGGAAISDSRRPILRTPLVTRRRNTAELLDLAASYRDVPPTPVGLSERQYQLLELDDDLEIWAIHWPVDGRLELHDHGGANGAFWVHRGTLIESAPGRSGRLTRRRVLENTGVGFHPEYVHDVVNDGPVAATSIHVYSPPMPAMTFYRLGADGLQATRTQWRDDPNWAP